MSAGLFITLEGGEGTGKSTHARRLVERLKSAGHSVVLTREPGGAPGAEDIRRLLVTGAPERWSPLAEALLNYAARDAHLTHTIRPALARGAIVVCDRFMDSTRAYQGFAGGVDMKLIDDLEAVVVRASRPDLTLVFDLDPELGLQRARTRTGDGNEDRYENKGLAFHRALRFSPLPPAMRNAVSSSMPPPAWTMSPRRCGWRLRPACRADIALAA
jgi:dTMP kinase